MKWSPQRDWLTPITTQSCNFFLVMRTFKTYSLGNFRIYNTVLLTIVAMLYTSSPGLLYFMIGSSYLLTSFTYFIYPTPLFYFNMLLNIQRKAEMFGTFKKQSPSWKQQKYLSTGEWIKMWYVYTIDYYSAIPRVKHWQLQQSEWT